MRELIRINYEVVNPKENAIVQTEFELSTMSHSSILVAKPDFSSDIYRMIEEKYVLR